MKVVREESLLQRRTVAAKMMSLDWFTTHNTSCQVRSALNYPLAFSSEHRRIPAMYAQVE